MAEIDKSMLLRLRARVHDVLEAGHPNDRWSVATDCFLVTLIILNVIAFACETVASIEAKYGAALAIFDAFSVAVFTVEFILRIWSCVELPPLRHFPGWSARLRFALRPMLIIDLLAIAPFYLGLVLANFGVDLRVLRVLRLLRFFKIARYSPAIQTLGQVIINERHALFGALIVMVALILGSSTIIYFLERNVQPEAFGSVPEAAWWAIATLTTVGYGDVTPITMGGRLFGALVMLFGLGMFALPIGIMATGFSQEINRHEFVVTWSMVARVPLFERLKAGTIAKVMGVLKSQSFPAGGIVIAEDESVHSMYFITAGEVLVTSTDGTERTLDGGDYFGERALFGPGPSPIEEARAITRCDVLILERRDFDRLRAHDREVENEMRRILPKDLRKVPDAGTVEG